MNESIGGRIFGVRPNLNKKGYVTLHPVGPNGGVDYGHAASHVDKGVVLRYMGMHTSDGKQKEIQRTGVKKPCACVYGELAGLIAPQLDLPYWSDMPTIKYDPFIGVFSCELVPRIGDSVVVGYDFCFVWTESRR